MVFKTIAFDHSAISPHILFYRIAPNISSDYEKRFLEG